MISFNLTGAPAHMDGLGIAVTNKRMGTEDGQTAPLFSCDITSFVATIVKLLPHSQATQLFWVLVKNITIFAFRVEE